jgi:hypothetical protein
VLTFAGDQYRLEPRDLEWLKSFSTLHFAAGEQTARELVAAEIDARLDAIFTAASAQLPEFADWYYSLRGEYTRLAMAALSYADLAEPDYVAKQAAAMLFPEQAWDTGLRELQGSAAATPRPPEHLRAGWLAGDTGGWPSACRGRYRARHVLRRSISIDSWSSARRANEQRSRRGSR